ncbi:hypothetical protein FOVSG1_013233 [Fusarium oxysporum f. sp. vasinfectum]
MSRLACAVLTASYFLTLPIYLDIEQRTISGSFFGAVVWLLFTVVMGLSSTAETAARLHGRVPFEANCWDSKASFKATSAIFAFYLIPAVTAMLAGLTYLVGKCTKRPADKVPVLGWLFFRVPWRILSSIFFFIFMWTALGSLFILRADIASVNGGGVQESEGSWGFGQILALATWVPVVEEAIVILFKIGLYVNQRQTNKHYVSDKAPAGIEEAEALVTERTSNQEVKTLRDIP